MSSSPPRGSTHGIPGAWFRALNVAAILLLVGFAAMVANPATRMLGDDLLTGERGPVEIGTFLGFAWAAAMAFHLSREARRRDPRRSVALVYAGVAAFCLFAALEEISWGQSLFDFPTPSWLRYVNEQGETNLHDLPGVMELNSACVFVFAIAGLAGTRLAGRPRWRPFAVPGELGPLFAIITTMAALEMLNDYVFLGYWLSPRIGVLSEAVELLGATACVATVAANRRVLRRQWADDEAVAEPDPAARPSGERSAA